VSPRRLAADSPDLGTASAFSETNWAIPATVCCDRDRQPKVAKVAKFAEFAALRKLAFEWSAVNHEVSTTVQACNEP
jgi:hypothetical protein